MRVLVTGNMGYVGPGVVRHLRAADPRTVIVGLDMGYFSHCLTNSPRLPECSVDVQYFGDVRFPPEAALAGVDAVVYLAAISNDPMGQQFERATLDVNCRAASRVAKAAKQPAAPPIRLASGRCVRAFAERRHGGGRSEQNPPPTERPSELHGHTPTTARGAPSPGHSCQSSDATKAARTSTAADCRPSWRRVSACPATAGGCRRAFQTCPISCGRPPSEPATTTATS